MRGIVLVAIAVGLASCPCLTASAPLESDIGGALARGDWVAVGAAARAWATTASEDPVPVWLLGYASVAQQDYRQAAAAFSRLGDGNTPAELLAWAGRLAQSHPGSAIARMLQGDALCRSGRNAEALAALDEAVRLDEASALIASVRGLVREAAFQHEEAIADFERAIELDPTFADAHANLGVARLSDGDLVAATASLSSAVELAPDFALAYNARGVANCQAGEWAEGEADFRKAEMLAPGLALVRGNLQWLAWKKAEEGFRIAGAEENGAGRGTTLLAASVARHPVDLGKGRIMNVWEIKSTALTATQEGMNSVYRYIREQELVGSGLPNDWRPAPLLAQPGMGNSAAKAAPNFARAALNSGNDFVICQATPEFRWSNPLAAVITEEVARRIERGVVAANEIYGSPPSLLLESQASRLIGESRLGSETLSSLASKGTLDQRFRVRSVVAYAVPFTDMRVGDSLRGRLGNVTTISSDFRPASGLPNASIADVPTIKLRLPDGRAPTHADLCSEAWPKGLTNPLPEITGQLLRGVDVTAVQGYADSWRGLPRTYYAPANSPEAVVNTMASMTGRMMTGKHDRVLIACQDRGLAESLADTHFGGFDSGRARWTPETDPSRLQRIALDLGCSYVNRIGGPTPQPQDPSALPAVPERADWTLPEMRALIAKADVLGRWGKVAYDAAKESGVKLPGWVGPIANAGEWLGPLATDLDNLRRGELFRVGSRTAERAFDKAVDSLLRAPGVSDYLKAEALKANRLTTRPSWKEIEYRVDSLCKPLIGFAVFELTGETETAYLAAKHAGLVRDTIDALLIEPVQSHAFTNTMVAKYHEYAAMLEKRNSQIPTMSEYLTAWGYRPQDARISTARIAREDAWALDRNTQLKALKTGDRLPSIPITPPVITDVVPDEMWKKIVLFPPPDKYSGAGVVSPSYRLPSSSSAGDKPGGVKMRADVVKGEPADTSEMFGASAPTEGSGVPSQPGLLAPHLLFCSLLSASR